MSVKNSPPTMIMSGGSHETSSLAVTTIESRTAVSCSLRNTMMGATTTPRDETVFPQGHELHDRIVYDRVAGQYYDRNTDLYLSDEEVEAYKE